MLKNFLRNHWPEITLIVLVFVLLVVNIRPNQYLLGWDSTTPELNLPLNFSRYLFGVWQEYRGLGTQDGMAHTALMVQWVYAALLDAFLPTSWVRPVLQLLTLLAGGWGVLRLALDFLLPQTQKLFPKKPISTVVTQGVALAASLLYMFNLMTVQMYHLPLELFSFHFALLPWGLWGLLRFYDKATARNALMLLLINVAGASQAHVPTVVLSYGVLLGVFSLAYWLAKKVKVQQVLLAVGILVIANSFWGVPYFYSALHKSAEISLSKQNVIGTPSAFSRNHAWGTLDSLATFGGFTFSYTDWNEQTQQFEPLMSDWITFWRSPFYRSTILLVSFLIALTSIYLAYLAVRKKNSVILTTIALFIVAFVLLGTNVPVVGAISAALREYVPLYEQIFRFTFTKFSLLYALAYSLVFVLCAGTWVRLLHNFSLQKTLIALLVVMPLVLATPAWRGNLFYNKLWVSLPESYQDISNYLSGIPDARVISLPIHSLWGWTTNTTAWGYRGSGFFWQMNSAPLVDRSFDPWEDTNETAYLQLSQAVYTSDTELFTSLLKKYRITHLLLDASVFHPGNYQENLYKDELSQMLHTPDFSLVQQSGDLQLYGVTNALGIQPTISDPVQELQNYTTQYTKTDAAYEQLGKYISGGEKTAAGSFPFSPLQSDRPITTSISQFDTYSTVTSNQIDQNKSLIIPNYSELEPVIPLAVTVGATTTQSEYLLPWQNKVPKEYYFSLPGTPRLDYLTINNRLSAVLTVSHPDLLLYIPSTEPSTLDIYQGEPSFSYQQPFDTLASNSTCLHEYQLDTYSIKNTVAHCQIDTIKIPDETKNEAKLQDESQLIAIFIQVPKTSVNQKICIFVSKEPTNCINSTTQVISDTDTERQITTSFVRKINQTFEIELATTDAIKLRNLAVQVHPIKFSTVLDPKNVLAVTNSQTVAVNDEISFSFSKPKALQKIDFATRSVQTNINCSTKANSGVTKNIGDDGVTYITKNGGTLCDSLLLPELSDQARYILTTQSEKRIGAGSKLFLVNPTTKRFDLEWIFPKEGGAETLGIWPSYNPQSKPTNDFELSISAESFGFDTNQTRINSIDLQPLPLKWLTNIRVANAEKILASEKKFVFSKIGTVYYKASIDDSKKENLLTLPQSYDPAWIAFPSNRPWQLLDHRTYNGWANAWIVPAGTTTVTMLFWPQLLSFFGYGMLTITFGWLTVATLRQRTNQRSTAKTQEAHPQSKPTSYKLHHFVIRRFAKLRKRLLGE